MNENLYFKERYRAIALISQGKWDKTFLAVDESASTSCVVIQRSPQIYAASIDAATKLFEQEALQLKKLGSHPQIPTLLNYFSFGEYFYLVQEFIEGSNLAEVSEKQGAFTEAQIWQLLAQLLPVIKSIGDAGCIHRDIQPKNIIRPVGDRNLVLTGFSPAQLQSQIDLIVGSPEYIAPEQARGKAVFASDLYSLGVTCIYLLTLISPFDLFDVVNDCWTWRDYLTNNVSDCLADIIDKLLQRDLDKRWQSAAEAIQYIAPEPIYTPPKTPKSLQSCLHSIKFPSPVNAVAICPQGRILACGGDNRAIALCDLATNQIVSTLHGHCQAIRAVAFSPDGILATGSDDRAVALWDLNNAKEACLSAHSGAVRAIAFSPNGQILASASGDKTIKLWDTTTYQELGTLTGHKLPVTAIAFHPQGNLLASASLDRTICLWQLPVIPTGNLENRPQHIFRGHVWAVLAVAFSPDGKILATSGDDKTIVLWNVYTRQEIRTLSGHSWSIVALSFSPDGETLFSGSWDKSIKAWQVSTGLEIATFSGHTDSVCAIAICPIAKLIASASKDATVKLWSFW